MLADLLKRNRDPILYILQGQDDAGRILTK